MFRPMTPMTGLLILELGISAVAVIVFLLILIGDYRMQAWRNGGSEGWNSDPTKRIYYYANFKEPPEIAKIWTRELSDSTLAISIVSLLSVSVCVLCVRLKYMSQNILLLYYVLLECLWIYTLGQQSSGDSTDEEHVSPRPWFLTHSCADAWSETRGACHSLQAGLIVSLLMVCLCSAHVVAIVWGLWRECKLLGRGWDQLRITGETDPRGKYYQEIPYAAGEDDIMELRDHIGMHRAQEQALSPVLAFFPESPPRPCRSEI